jgi:hypothetical protein
MLLIIHAGLHKTASTYLQSVLERNRDALLKAGLYIQPETGMNANHSTAWAAHIGDFIGVREHMRLATLTHRQPILLSSEDFESLIFQSTYARTIEQIARQSGITEVEWHFCLRDPGEYFASQYAELAKSVFVDFVAMFESVMRDGRFDVSSASRRHPDSWSHCFDYETHITAFTDEISGEVVLHDFRDGDPFPGHAIVERATDGKIGELGPGADDARNERLSPPKVAERQRTRLASMAQRAGLPPDVADFITERPNIPEVVLSDCAAAVSRRFAPGMERLLQMKRLQGGRPVG